MNITHLEYIITVVECGYNLTLAAKKLHITQPALSRLIVRFEENENTTLFIRQNGRLVGLTAAGESLYSGAIRIVDMYSKMLNEIHELSLFHGGTIRIGIPPLVVSVLFTKILSRLISINPNIKFDVVENGAFELINQLERGELDIGICLSPNEINLRHFEEVTLFKDELAAFMNEQHPLAQVETDRLKWKDLHEQKIVTFDEGFMIHHHLFKKFRDYTIKPDITFQTSSWDFLLETVRQSNALTLLPKPVIKYANLENIEIVEIEDSLPWEVTMIYPKKTYYSVLENYVVDSFKQYFINQADTTEIKRLEIDA